MGLSAAEILGLKITDCLPSGIMVDLKFRRFKPGSLGFRRWVKVRQRISKTGPLIVHYGDINRIASGESIRKYIRAHTNKKRLRVMKEAASTTMAVKMYTESLVW